MSESSEAVGGGTSASAAAPEVSAAAVLVDFVIDCYSHITSRAELTRFRPPPF